MEGSATIARFVPAASGSLDRSAERRPSLVTEAPESPQQGRLIALSVRVLARGLGDPELSRESRS